MKLTRQLPQRSCGTGRSDTSSLSQSGDEASPLRPQSAFTLVEIALSIAIIGFALVAIIGVLPAGLNVQKENREETIIVHDANYFLDAIRSGARGLDDLTNYVESIKVVSVLFAPPNQPVTNVYDYTYTDYRVNNTPQGEPELSKNTLTNGVRIVGLLSTPKYLYPPVPPPGPSSFESNYVFAYVRALSGPAVEKAPQQNAAVKDLAFRYRLLFEVVPYRNWSTNWVDFQANGLSPNEIIARSNYWQTAKMLQNNMHEVRLIFRWPVKANGETGNQRQVFRTLVGGVLSTNVVDPAIHPRRWFVQPGTYQIPL